MYGIGRDRTTRRIGNAAAVVVHEADTCSRCIELSDRCIEPIGPHDYWDCRRKDQHKRSNSNSHSHSHSYAEHYGVDIASGHRNHEESWKFVHEQEHAHKRGPSAVDRDSCRAIGRER